MTYKRRASPLHAARAGAALAWFAALAVALLTQSNPVILGVVALSVLVAAACARVGRLLLRAVPYALGLALMVCVVNALVARNGLTVIWRFGEIPLLGQVNVTLEATVYGAVLGVRAAALVMLGLLYTLAVDPDEVLRALRRVSFRSALTATVATRMVPILLRDGQRLAEAQRCRPGRPPGRLQLLQATTAGVLDRALNVAATLEVRGYSSARAPLPASRRPWSRHDLAFTAAAVVVTSLAITGRVAGSAPFTAYPSLRAPAGPDVLALAVALAVATLAPFLDRRGIRR